MIEEPKTLAPMPLSNPINSTKIPPRAALPLILVFSLQISAFSQELPQRQAASQNTSAAPKTTRLPADADTDEIITLEEFTVTGQSMKDAYLASESTTGTRFSGDIVNLPYNVQVLTDEFVQDFGFYSEDDLVGFIAGSTSGGGYAGSDEDGGGITIRGFSGTSLRDGFLYYTAMGGAFVTDRTEVMKGPASILYGRTSPGGIRNSISKKPASTAGGLSRVFINKYGRGGGFFAKGPLRKGNLYYAASAEFTHSESPIPYDWTDTTLLYGSLLWKPTKHIGLTLTAAAKWTRGNYAPGNAPGSLYYAGGTAPVDPVTGLPIPYAVPTDARLAVRGWNKMALYNGQGPQTASEWDRHSLHAVYEQRFSRRVSFRLSALALDYESFSKSFIESSRYYAAGYPTPLLAAAHDPLVGATDTRYYAAQAELLAKFDTGKIPHQLLLLLDWARRDYDNARYSLNPADTGNPAILPTNVRHPDPSAPPFWDFDRWDLVTYVRAGERFKDDKSHGLTLSLSSTPHPRLALMASGRYDAVRLHQISVAAGGGPLDTRGDARGDDDNLSYSLAANYKILPEKFSAYINHSTSFNDSPGTLTIDSRTGNFVAPTTSIGYEIGLKGADLLGGRFFFTLAAADITKDHIRMRNPRYNEDPDEPQFTGAGKQQARGIEFSSTLIATPQTTLQLNASRTKTKVLNHDDIWNIGGPVQGNAPWNISSTIRHTFKRKNILGLINTLRIGLAFRYQNSYIARWEQRSTVAGHLGEVTEYVCWVNPGATFDAFMSFNLPRPPGFKHAPSINLRCNNLFDHNFVAYNGRYFNHGRILTLTAQLNF
jgi:outer membrane receptor protein involved in Fe transport